MSCYPAGFSKNQITCPALLIFLKFLRSETVYPSVLYFLIFRKYYCAGLQTTENKKKLSCCLLDISQSLNKTCPAILQMNSENKKICPAVLLDFPKSKNTCHAVLILSFVSMKRKNLSYCPVLFCFLKF